MKLDGETGILSTKITTKLGTGLNVLSSGSGSAHSYSDDENNAFTNVINEILKADEDLADIMPINPDSTDLFHHCENGILLW